MKIILAVDSFKECMSSEEIEGTIAAALGRDHEIVSIPVSDGGEGFTACMTSALGGRFLDVTARGPLGDPVTARVGICGRTGVADTASASGLSLVPPSRRDPSIASSYGTGQLIRELVNQEVEKVYLGLGGTATNDGGAGLVEALGPCDTEIHCFYDVDVPFWGKGGASEMFGPQKGAGPEMVASLDRRLEALCREYSRIAGRDIRTEPGAGAAGGIGGAMAAVYGARMHRGIQAYLSCCDLVRKLEGASLVITGEGRADRQTLCGKVPAGVLEEVRRLAPGVPVVLLAGRIEDREALEGAGFRAMIEVTPREMPLEEALAKETASENIRRAVRQFMTTLH